MVKVLYWCAIHFYSQDEYELVFFILNHLYTCMLILFVCIGVRFDGSVLFILYFFAFVLCLVFCSYLRHEKQHIRNCVNRYNTE